MNTSPQIAFWQTLAGALESRANLLAALDQAAAKVADTEFHKVMEALRKDIVGGKTLSQAMDRHEAVFSRASRAMVRAGEMGGVLDVCVRRLADGWAEGSFPLDADAPAGGLAEYWLAFGLLLSSGVPILEALDVAAIGCGDERTREATRALRQSVLAGEGLAKGMMDRPDLFAREVSAAIAWGEGRGQLDSAAMAVGRALRSGSVSRLAAEAPPSARPDGEDKGVPAAIEWVKSILVRAAKDRASDIHLDPTQDGRGRVRIRVDGVLRETTPPPEGLWPAVVSRFKIMSALDLAERQLPQDGRVMTIIADEAIDFRLSIMPTMWGERVVLRLLRQDSVIIGLDRIVGKDDLEKVRALCRLSHGVVISAGPAGSGKTTLLYSMILEIDRDKSCVMTIEDPVEYALPGVAQTQVSPQTGLSYARALRHILRQDPDVVMLGEVRDLETLQAMATCAMTGHLVFTTLHTNSGPGTLKRMMEVGLQPFLINSSVAAVISQRLVRMLCPRCRQAAEPALHSLPPEAVAMIREMKDPTFHAPKGCPECGGTGYRGRMALHEILVMDDRIRQAVAAGADLPAIRSAALAGGMKTLLMDGVAKAARGLTSLTEVLQVVPLGASE